MIHKTLAEARLVKGKHQIVQIAWLIFVQPGLFHEILLHSIP